MWDRVIVTEEVPAASEQEARDRGGVPPQRRLGGGDLRRTSPLRVDVVGGTGLKVADYPKGQPRAESSATDDPLARVGVYHGELVFTVAVNARAR